MKKLVLLLGLMFALQTAMMAQVQSADVIFNAHLANTFNLIVTNQLQDIYFATADDYNFGVTELIGSTPITPGYSEVQVEATANWNLTIGCNGDFMPYANGATNFIPINNLGFWISEDGSHTLSTGEVIYGPTSAANAQALNTSSTTPLISLGASPDGNGGGVPENAFTLHWLMGTMQGNMNTESMFIQLANGDFTTGDYTTTATITLTQE